MNPPDLYRLHQLRRETEAAGERMDALRPRFESLRDRHTNGTAPEAVSAFNLFQTPEPVAVRLAALLSLRGGERILEPSAGLGRLLRAVQPYSPGECVAVEVAPDCCRALFAMDFPGVTLRQGDFLAMTPQQLGQFDAVAMNPPFHMRADVRHIRHALTFLRPGGMLAGVCMAGPARESAFRSMAETWEPLPPETFRESGTNTPAVLFSIRA